MRGSDEHFHTTVTGKIPCPHREARKKKEEELENYNKGLKNDYKINFDENVQQKQKNNMLHVIDTQEKSEKLGIFDIYITDFKKAFGTKENAPIKNLPTDTEISPYDSQDRLHLDFQTKKIIDNFSKRNSANSARNSARGHRVQPVTMNPLQILDV